MSNNPYGNYYNNPYGGSIYNSSYGPDYYQQVNGNYSAQTNFSRYTGNWKFKEGSNTYVGRFVSLHETRDGDKLSLEFGDGSTYVLLLSSCRRSRSPISAKGPDTQPA